MQLLFMQHLPPTLIPTISGLFAKTSRHFTALASRSALDVELGQEEVHDSRGSLPT